MDYNQSILDLIRARCSRRSYTAQAVEAAKLEALGACFATVEGVFGSKARFAILDTAGWGEGKINALGTYGTIRGARLFLVGMIARGEDALEDFGYQFERIILRATDLGLGTCWIGGIFNRTRFADQAGVRDEEVLPAISPLGYPTARRSIADSIIRWSAGSTKRRPWDELFFDGGFEVSLTEAVAGRYRDALEMVRLGPSASNRQPWRIVKARGKEVFHVYLRRSRGYDKLIRAVDLQRLDMGIALCHFDLAAKAGNLNGHWERLSPSCRPVAERLEYVCSWVGQ